MKPQPLQCPCCESFDTVHIDPDAIISPKRGGLPLMRMTKALMRQPGSIGKEYTLAFVPFGEIEINTAELAWCSKCTVEMPIAMFIHLTDDDETARSEKRVEAFQY